MISWSTRMAAASGFSTTFRRCASSHRPSRPSPRISSSPATRSEFDATRTATRPSHPKCQTPASPEGPLAPPGVYTLTLAVDGKSYTQSVTVRNDPRSPATAADLRAQHELQMKLYAGGKAAWDGYNQIAAARAAVSELLRG